MLTVHAESALLLMSDSKGWKILMIYYRELVIHSNPMVICECQDINMQLRQQRAGVSQKLGVYVLWTYYMNVYVHMNVYTCTHVNVFALALYTNMVYDTGHCM